MRIGLGEDSHRFEKGKDLVMGGIKIKDCPGLKANSDGDVVLHAICNALSSSIGKGSLSTYADKMCKEGIKDSSEYLKKILKCVMDKGFSIENIAISIECKIPKIEPIRDQIQENIAKILLIDKDQVGITATSGEELTSFGKGEGIKTIATALLK